MGRLIVAYCLTMGVTTALCALWLRRNPAWRRLLLTTALVAIALAGGASALGKSLFPTARLLGYGVFVFLPAHLALAAWLCRKGGGWQLRAPALLAATLALAGLDAYWIEPHWLQVTHHRIESAKVRQPFRIAVLSDLQADVFGDFERNALRRALAEKPDVIVLTGDYIQAETGAQWEALAAQIHAYLREIDFAAPLGVYAVGGNTDFTAWPLLFEGLPVTTFEETASIDAGRFTLTGLSSLDSMRPRLRVPGRQDFHIVIGHSPNFALGSVDADLLVAGHTHGGQIRLPWIGPLETLSRVPRAWAAGVTKLPDGGVLAVSRGVGMVRLEAPRVRFLCRPEVMILDVVAPAETP
ncbi:MAG: hypothetical protein GC160_26935 [Acidobacteria bacterium]|nr:hypothetical protein [Acidobacteriota bacterium]